MNYPEVGQIWVSKWEKGTPVKITEVIHKTALSPQGTVSACFYKVTENELSEDTNTWGIAAFLRQFRPAKFVDIALYRKYGDINGSPENNPRNDPHTIEFERKYHGDT